MNEISDATTPSVFPCIIHAMPSDAQPTVPGPVRIVGFVFGFAFFGIGLTVIGFLWFAPSPAEIWPALLPFRLVGSFIAICFVAVGGTIAWSSLLGKAINPSDRRVLAPTAHAGSGSYNCTHCAAPLGARADVSPSGDVKCPFCNGWFNIHKQV